MASCKVKVLDSNIPEELLPCIVEFTNGSLKNEKSNPVSFNLFKRLEATSSSRSTADHRMVARCNGNEYCGSRKKDAAGCTFYLGILDDETSEMQIVKTNMFKLKPAILGNSIVEVERNVEEVKDDKSTYMEKNDDLVKAFGSARQKRSVASRQKHNVDKAAVGVKVVEAVTNLESPQVPTGTSSVTASMSMLPTMNRDAVTPSDIYPVQNIITSKEEAALLSSYRRLSNQNADIQTLFTDGSSFINDCLTQLPLDNDARRTKACQLLYLDYLIHFHGLKFSDIRGKDILPDFPMEIKNRFFSTFTVGLGNSRSIPKKLKDKMLCYILILSLIVVDFTLDCSLLMKDLKVGSARLCGHLKAIGCSVKTTNHPRKRKSTDFASDEAVKMSIVATLSAPLSKRFKFI